MQRTIITSLFNIFEGKIPIICISEIGKKQLKSINICQTCRNFTSELAWLSCSGLELIKCNAEVLKGGRHLDLTRLGR